MDNTQIDPLQAKDGDESIADALYDAYMNEHEPDLLDENIDSLDEKYSGESPEDKAAREARYEEAFAGYEAMVKDLVKDMNEHNRQARRKALKSEEAKDTAVESEKLKQVDEAISNM